MPKYVISDASVFIVLDKIGHLELLKKIYNVLYTTPEILEEFGGYLPDWIKIIPSSDRKYQSLLETRIDPGEASIIALAKEMEDTLLILDDLKARKIAKQLQIRFTGTLGILIKAKELGFIDKLLPIIQKLIENDFRISNEVIREILSRSGESANR